MNRRKRALCLLFLSLLWLTAIALAGSICAGQAVRTDFSMKNMAPCLQRPFGTDWMGRDMLSRTLTGLSMSIRLGLCTAGISALLALVLGTTAALSGRYADACISFVIDAILGIPHILLLILVSCACGKGFRGVVVGVSLTHWPSLARVIRSEVLQQKNSEYIRIAEKLGMSRGYIAAVHILPHLLPQFMVGMVLIFPHAVLHEASITFLGFGLSSEQPAIGVILSESMRYLITGKWWLALLPGLMLVSVVMLFHAAGGAVRRLLDPFSAQE